MLIINDMTITDFKDKIVATLNRNYEKTGSITPVFLYVTSDMEFKSVGLERLVTEKSSEYIALFLKEYTRDKKPLFTAYINHSDIKQFKPSDWETFMDADFNPDETSNFITTPTVAIDIISTSKDRDRIILNYESVGTEDEPKLRLISEIRTKLDKGSLPNLF
jgi:hypothetical protein